MEIALVFTLKQHKNFNILLKRWRGDFKKKEFCQIYQQRFHFKDLTQIEWSISKKQKMEESSKQKVKIRITFSITVLNLIQIQKLDLSEYLLIIIRIKQI